MSNLYAPTATTHQLCNIFQNTNLYKDCFSSVKLRKLHYRDNALLNISTAISYTSTKTTHYILTFNMLHIQIYNIP